MRHPTSDERPTTSDKWKRSAEVTVAHKFAQNATSVAALLLCFAAAPITYPTSGGQLWKSMQESGNGRISNHTVSQKLSVGALCIKLNSLSLGLAKSRFYEILHLKHKSGRIPSPRVSQKLSVGAFCIKPNSLSFGLAKS